VATGLLTLIILARRKRNIVLIGLVVIAFSFKYLLPITAVGSERIARLTTREIVVKRVSKPFERALRQVSDYPLGYGVATGVGSGRIFDELRQAASARKGAYIENDIGRCLGELGLPGLFFWLWMLWVAIRRAIEAARRTSDLSDHLMLTCIVGGMSLILVQLSVGPALFDAAAGIHFWTFAAIMACVLKKLEQQQTEEKTGDQIPQQKLIQASD